MKATPGQLPLLQQPQAQQVQQVQQVQQAVKPAANNVSKTNNPFASASLYVGDLLESVTEAALFEKFNTIGPVASIRVCRDSRSRKSLGYAYVNFHSVQDAEKALDTMNFQLIGGRACRIMWSQRDPRLRQSGKGNIFVNNLHHTIDNKTLFDTFGVFGKILSCKVAIDKKTGASLGYGYVHYITPASAEAAIKGVHGMTISGKEVSAELFKSRSERARANAGKEMKFTNVYVKYIPADVTKEKLIELFEEETKGKITSSSFWDPAYGKAACLNFETAEQAKKAVELFNGRDISNDKKDDEKKEEKEDDAKEVRKLYVARAQKKAERLRNFARQKKEKAMAYRGNSAANLYVKNIDIAMTNDQLKALFAPYGNILSVCIMCDKEGKSRGFGFVQFDRKESALKAKASLNSQMHQGRPLYVSIAQSKAYREKFLKKSRRGGSFSRNRGRGGFRNNAMFPGMGGQPQFGAAYPGQFMAAQRFGAGPYGPPMHGYPQNPMMMNRPIGYNPMFLQQATAPQPQSINTSQLNPMASLQNQAGIHSGFNPVRPQQNSASIVNYQNSQSRGNIAQTQTSTGLIGAHSASQTQQQAASSTQQHSIPIQQQPQQSIDQSSQQTSAPIVESTPLTTNMLQNAKPAERKRLIGERLFPKIQVVEPRLAGKITGMLLEMDNTELLLLLSDQQALMTKINEALAVLKDHQQKQSQSNVASGANSSNPNRSQPNRSSAANRGSTSNQNAAINVGIN